MADALRERSLDSFFEDWEPELDSTIRGNAALQPEEKPEAQPKPHRHIRPVQKPKPAAKRRRDGSKALFVVSAMVLLIGALSIVTTYSQVYTKKAQIRALKAELEEAKELTAILSEAPELNMSMTEIYEYATNQLGMVEASGSDTVFIQTDHHSYTQVTEDTESAAARVTFHWFS